MRDYSRDRHVFEMRQDGAALAAVGRLYGISRERIRQIVLRHERYVRERGEGNFLLHGKRVYINLDARVRNCLKNYGIDDLAQVVDLIEEDLTRLPNFGKISLANLKTACKENSITIGSNRPGPHQYKLEL